MFKRIAVAALILFISSFAAAQDPNDEAIHDELRGLLTGIEAAINEERYGDLPQFSDLLPANTWYPLPLWSFIDGWPVLNRNIDIPPPM